MADEVPVCDVLCEAMEYLSKLGSNLRNRSETLKEKKIRKDKLKNAHAVQKAANKVLLICELSKKSLDNVETGVRRILRLVDASQASIRDGGKNATSDKSHTKYQYFQYRSKKLKVAKKVPLKHYMSVKVLAKSMPPSMQDKYPVYYDCKLYRLRKRNARKVEIKREKSADRSSRRNSSVDRAARSVKVEDKKSKIDSDSSEDETEKTRSGNKTKGKKARRYSDKSENDDNEETEKKEKNHETPSNSSDETENKELVAKKSDSSKSSKRRELRTDSESSIPKGSRTKNLNKRKNSRLSSSESESDTKTSPRGKVEKSVSRNCDHDEDSDSRKESDTEQSGSKKSSKRKESRTDSETSPSKNGTQNLNERKGSRHSSPEPDSDQKSSSRRDSDTKKSKESEDSDNKHSDTEKSLSQNSSKRTESRKASSDSESHAKKSSKKNQRVSFAQKSKDDRASDSNNDSDTEKSHSQTSSKRTESKQASSDSESDAKKSSKKNKQVSFAQKSKNDGASDSNNDSDTEKSHSQSSSKRTESKQASSDSESDAKKSSKKNKQVSFAQRSKNDGASDSNNDSDTEKSHSQTSSKRTDSKQNSSDSESDAKKSSKKNKQVSFAQKSKNDRASDSNNDSDTEKSSSKKTSRRRNSDTKKWKDKEESDESDTEKSHSKKTSQRKESRKDSSSSKSTHESESKKEKDIKAKKFKNIRVIDESSTSSKEDLQKDKETAVEGIVDLASSNDDNDSPCHRLSSEEPIDTKQDEQMDKALGRETEDKTIDSDQSPDSKSESQKPIIKCVSLSKLLKPDVLPVEEIAKQKIDSKRMKESKSSLKKIQNENKSHTKPKKLKFEDEEEFWVQKRKEVKAFKAKDFKINVTRLPPLSVQYLIENNLNKITQNGSSICEVRNKSIDSEIESSNQSKECSQKLKKQSSKKADDNEINKVKNDLLNDSDSDNSDSNSKKKQLKSVSETVKNALLNESDSDNNEANESQQSDRPQNSKANENLLSDSPQNDEANESRPSDRPQNGEANESERNESEPKKNSNENETQAETLQSQAEKTPERELSPINDPDKVKSSLLMDSSEDSPKTPHSKTKNSESTTPQSKRKHIMESMHAKKMLLTYSSSSETEDEQLNNVLKDIQVTLLKEISSGDENTVKKTVSKKLLASSDSDDDVLKRRVKKKRKLNTSKSPSETDEANTKSCDAKDGDADANDTSCIDQVDGNVDEESSSSSKKMGRSRGKPAASSSQNSDTQDDKDIDGLTDMNTLNRKSRARDSQKAGTSSTRSKKMPKTVPLITGEGLLEAPISSDEASAEENDAVEEDLPAVTLSGLNGSGIDHLAKDDLLRESDSSDSSDKNKPSEEDKQDGDSDTEDTLKAKRRKAANAISSDSEGGSSRRKPKDADVRMSDFEDSGDDSEPAKRAKRKKKGSDSDGSAGGSSDEGGKKKRRRIKPIDSDGSGSDSENEGRNKHGRKNIRKVMGKNQLEEATKKAARQEKERMARIAERQKLYNNLQFDESGKPDEVVLDKVVLDFDPETKEPLIEVDRGLVKKLKPHQANGIKFMWDACFESVKRIKKDRGSGCILAHCMGLGKTLQVVSLTHTLLTHRKLTNVRRVLVVCPLSTVLNWVNEFRMWLKHSVRDYEVDVYELSRFKQNSERAFQLSQWFESGGVCVLGYEMFRNLSADNPKKFKKKMLKAFQESLVDPGPDMVVCDEGHLLKNEKTSLSQSMNRVRTLRRIVLTGTPLQNNLKEYYCMVQFVKPNLLGKYNEYLNRFVNPITNGQYTDSTEHDIRVMKRRSHVLHKMLDGAVQRRDYGVLAPFLPPKHEYVLFITLTEVQVKLYQHYLDNYARRPQAGKSSGFLFPDFQSLQRIWTHPLVLKYNSERYEIMQQKKRDREEEDSEGSLVDFIDDDSTGEETSTDESSDDSSDMSDDSRKKNKKKKDKGKKSKGKDSKGGQRRGTRANPVELVNEEMKDPDILEVKNDNPTEWWINLVNDEVLEDLRNSNKLVLLFEILRQCEAIGDKLLVFSQSLYSLDLIEEFLRKVDEATQEGRIDEKLGGHVGSWSPGVDYFRLDGSTSCENRSIWCKNFNREDNPRARLFLISTRAGGLGINLVAANRVVIFDVSWNPSHDVQSIFRVYRFGQKKPCYIYRFLAMGTMEEKIYERQVTKQAISKRVIDEQQIDRHYAANDLAELYMFEPAPPMPRPVPPVPKDRFFAEMLKEHEASIYKFHEHDSLLENKEEETLSEEERKAAWEDFENEKNKPPPSPFPSGWPMHNGMMPNMLAQQQQQQLAYAALATMLRKEMPNVSDDQIRSMLPLIYGANPGMFGGYDYGLMQKLNDMYKYTAQPGMMNPAASMMNSVMNAAGGAAAMGGGGSSGLQYEPPWQRQQQQQQQMRLQQLMQQQQNSMGAKFYAGGLGSRDPIAMALQQQRAREIMIGDRGRPRGRPPLQPRLPSAAAGAAAGDVVNLDSD